MQGKMAPDTVNFRCNVCGKSNTLARQALTREAGTCAHCGSTVRMRAIVHLVTSELLGESMALPDIKTRHADISGIGMSCWVGYAERLAEKFDYTNTYYHQKPLLDITDVDPALESSLDFIVSSDVFEHVAPPVSVAFKNAYRLLKPNGVFIFTVPYGYPGKPGVPTLEHFPDLYKYELLKKDGKQILRNVTRNGEIQQFEELVFHGGAGKTLEMRIFSESALLDELKNAGFDSIKIHNETKLEFGIAWQYPWALPITARRAAE